MPLTKEHQQMVKASLEKFPPESRKQEPGLANFCPVAVMADPGLFGRVHFSVRLTLP